MSRNPSYTELENRLAALQDENSYYRMIAENATDLLSKHDPNGVCQYASPTFRHLLGYKPEEMIGRKAVDFFHPDDLEKIQKKYRDILDKEMNASVSHRIKHKQGHFIWVKSTGRAIRNPNTNEIEEIIATTYDLTERTRTERELESQSRFMSALMDNLQVGVFMVKAPSGKPILANKQAIRLLGRGLMNRTEKDTLAEMYQAFRFGTQDLYPPEQMPIVRALQGESSSIDDMVVVHPDGTEVLLEVFGSPIRDSQGEIVAGLVSFSDITKRKRTEESLRTMATQWQATFDAVNDSICVLDAEWTITQANKATMDILDLPADQIIGKKCFELVHGTSEPIVDCPVHRIEQTRSRESESVQVGERWIEVIADPLFGIDNKLQGVVHIMSDVTDRKNQNEALHQSEETLSSIFKAAPIGIGMVCDRIITQANERLCEMVGRAREELLQKEARILYPSDAEHEYVGKMKYEQIREKGTGTVETRWQHKSGAIRDILLSSTPINPDDWSEGVTFTALDITDRKQTEKRLNMAHNMFLTVLDGIDATIYVADMQTYEILFMNKHIIESFGRDMTGEICWEVFRNESGPCQICSNDKLIDENGNPTGLYTWQGQNPITKKWYINNDRAIQWIDGRLVRIQIATDITDVKNMEEGLRQAQKMESIGNLAGGIAHDFNNILFPIIGMSELLLQDLTPGSLQHQNVQQILQAGKRGRDLIQQILAFSRQSEQSMIPIRIQQIMKEVLTLSRSSIPADIDIVQDIQSDCGLVMADPTQIHQLAMNLITNAYHAVEPSGGNIMVQLKEVKLEQNSIEGSSLESGSYARLTVSDTGCGMDAHIRKKIFEPYFTTKRKTKGTGLGLSVVYGIAKEHGGDIIVQSELNQYTTFDVYFPLLADGVDQSQIFEKAEIIEKGNERILLVDDEEPIAQFEKQMLERYGYQVEARYSSLDALEAFKAKPHSFDLIITDMTMPNMTGDRLAKEVLSIRPDVPIIICTGFSARINEEKSRALGIKGFLLKPVAGAQMAKMVRSVLDEAK